MERRNKISLSIIIVLAILLVVMTYLYFDMREIAKRNLDAYFDSNNTIFELNIKINELENQLGIE